MSRYITQADYHIYDTYLGGRESSYTSTQDNDKLRYYIGNAEGVVGLGVKLTRHQTPICIEFRHGCHLPCMSDAYRTCD